MNKLLIICGPTATGKTDLGIFLAKKFDGEIVSADSRQVYRGMDIITGKDIPPNSELRTKNLELNIKDEKYSVGFRLKERIPTWLVDIVNPDYTFNVSEYRQLVHKVITDIWLRNKLPIMVGGTGFYIQSITGPIDTIDIPQDSKLREFLDKLPKKELQEKLKNLDKKKWKEMNNSDRNNPRRLVRAIEIANWKKENTFSENKEKTPKFQSLLVIGLAADKKTLYQRINQRIESRLKEGVLKEVKKLISKNYLDNLPSLSSTGYKELKNHIEGKIKLEEALKIWKNREHAYARRQMTWFKKDGRIVWFGIVDGDYINKIEKRVQEWYTSG